MAEEAEDLEGIILGADADFILRRRRGLGKERVETNNTVGTIYSDSGQKLTQYGIHLFNL